MFHKTPQKRYEPWIADLQSKEIEKRVLEELRYLKRYTGFGGYEDHLVFLESLRSYFLSKNMSRELRCGLYAYMLLHYKEYIKVVFPRLALRV